MYKVIAVNSVDSIGLVLKNLEKDTECSILGSFMDDPVLATDGHTYERGGIEIWFYTKSTSPNTNKPISKDLIPNTRLAEFKEFYNLSDTTVFSPELFSTPLPIGTDFDWVYEDGDVYFTGPSGEPVKDIASTNIKEALRAIQGERFREAKACFDVFKQFEKDVKIEIVFSKGSGASLKGSVFLGRLMAMELPELEFGSTESLRDAITDFLSGLYKEDKVLRSEDSFVPGKLGKQELRKVRIEIKYDSPEVCAKDSAEQVLNQPDIKEGDWVISKCYPGHKPKKADKFYMLSKVRSKSEMGVVIDHYQIPAADMDKKFKGRTPVNCNSIVEGLRPESTSTLSCLADSLFDVSSQATHTYGVVENQSSYSSSSDSSDTSIKSAYEGAFAASERELASQGMGAYVVQTIIEENTVISNPSGYGMGADCPHHTTQGKTSGLVSVVMDEHGSIRHFYLNEYALRQLLGINGNDTMKRLFAEVSRRGGLRCSLHFGIRADRSGPCYFNERTPKGIYRLLKNQRPTSSSSSSA